MSVHSLTIKDIDVEECDKCQSPTTGILANVPFLNSKDPGDWVEGDDLLEEIESAVT